MRDLRQEYNTADAHVTSCKRELSDYQRKTEDMKVAMQELEDHADSLSDALEKDDDGKLDALNVTLKDAEAKVRQHEASLEDAKAAVTETVENLKNLRRELKEKTQDLAVLEQNCNVAREEQQNVENKRHAIIIQKNGAIARIEDDRRNRDKVRDRRDQLSALILENVEKVSVFAGTRVPVDAGETVQSLSEKLSKSERDLQRYSDQCVCPPSPLLMIDPEPKLISGFLAGWVLHGRKLPMRLLQRRTSINERRGRWKR